MALREILGFNHIPMVDSSQTAQFAKAIGSLPLVVRGNAGNNKRISFGGSANPYLTCTVTTANAAVTGILNTSSFVKGTPRASVFGVRMKFLGLGTPVSGDNTAAIILASNSWGINNTDRINAFTLGELLNEGETTVNLAGAERYLELRLNWSQGTIDRRVDGKVLPPLPVTPSSLLTLFSARNIGMFLVAGNGVNTQWGFKDIYWLDDTEDDTLCTFLGPQMVIPVTLSVDSADGWVASSGTVQSVLDTPVTTSTPDTPTITSPELSQPLIATMSLNVSNIDSINGIGVTGAMLRQDGTASKAGFSLVKDGASSDTITLSPGTTMVHNQRPVAFEKAPDGTRLTIEIVNATKLYLTPTV